MRSMRGFLGVLLATLLLLPLGGAGVAGAVPKMVIDRSHGQQADVSGFAGVLVSKGWEVILDQPLTEQVLSDCSLLVVTQPITEFTANEVAVVKSYVQNGGGLWVLSDVADDYVWGSPPAELPPNALPRAFGVSFSAAGVIDYENPSYTYTPTIPIPGAFTTDPAFADYAPLFAGVTGFVYHEGVYLLKEDAEDPDGFSPFEPSSALPVVLTTSGSGYSDDWSDMSGLLPLFAAGKVGQGRVVFIGDATPLASTVYPTLGAGNLRLLDNIVAWAMKPEPVPPEEPTTKGEEPETVTVTINLRPWNPCNKINLDSKRFIRVAVMSTDGFDASRVDPQSVVFAGASPVCSRLMNVNRDRQKDLVLVFWIPDLEELNCKSTKATLIGVTLDPDKKKIWGEDDVRIVPNKKCKKPVNKGEHCDGRKAK